MGGKGGKYPSGESLLAASSSHSQESWVPPVDERATNFSDTRRLLPPPPSVASAVELSALMVLFLPPSPLASRLERPLATSEVFLSSTVGAQHKPTKVPFLPLHRAAAPDPT